MSVAAQTLTEDSSSLPLLNRQGSRLAFRKDVRSVQFRMVSMRSGKSINYALHPVSQKFKFPNVASETVPMDD